MRKSFFVVAVLATLTIGLSALAQKPSQPSHAGSTLKRPTTIRRTTPEQERPVDLGSSLTPEDQRFLELHRQAVERERLSYKGLRVVVPPDIEGQELALQRQVGAMLTRLEFIPTNRLKHFRFLTENGQSTITGWSARIVDMAPANHGYVVTLYVSADFAEGFQNTTFTIERYFISDSGIKHLSTVGAPVPRVSVF